jgi:UDP-N-acetylglucosamine 2-epimerase (non-hydrolysing)
MKLVNQPLRVSVVLGTRPEAIKLAPVVHELRRRPGEVIASVVSTGQHREMLAPMLDLFDLRPDADLDLQRHDQSLEHIVTSVLNGLPAALQRLQTSVLVVQGDTSTTFAASLAAFYRAIPVVHVEAGLRTPDPRNPFPEEMNRRLTTRLASLHLAPTPKAAAALRAEGVPDARIRMTGNTVVDALQWLRTQRADRLAAARPPELTPQRLEGLRLAVVTGHRRESFGDPFRDLCVGLRRAVEENADLLMVYPVHLNPRVQSPVREILGGHPRILLLPPVEYPTMLWLLERAAVVITDSGGIQEEAPSFGVRVLVTRTVTERTEGIDAGVSTLVGTDPRRIADEVRHALAAGRLCARDNPFGDGRAAARSVDAILELCR